MTEELIPVIGLRSALIMSGMPPEEVEKVLKGST